MHPALDLRTTTHQGLEHFIRRCNHHRPHAALDRAAPMNTLQALTGDNLPELHNESIL